MWRINNWSNKCAKKALQNCECRIGARHRWACNMHHKYYCSTRHIPEITLEFGVMPSEGGKGNMRRSQRPAFPYTHDAHIYAPEPISPSLQFHVNIVVKRQRNHQHHHLLEPVGKVFAMRPCRRRDSKNSKTEIIYTQKTDKNTNAQMIPGSPLRASISDHRMQG